MSPRPKNPPPDRRQEILEAALRVFGEKGYRAATNAEIAREAGVTPAALYYYFPSKAELFRAAVTERRGRILPALVAALGDDPTALPPRELFRKVLRAAIGFLTEERTQALLRIVLAEGPRDPSIVAIWEEQLTALVSTLLPYLERQMAAGKFRQMDPRLVLLMFQGPVLTTVIGRDLLKLPLLQGLSDDDLVESLVETAVAGLLTDQA